MQYTIMRWLFFSEPNHSSINVSLTYLRVLEVAELTYEDMPMV